WVRVPVLLAVTLVLSALTYRWVEVPFQRGRLPLSAGRPALALWPLALVVVRAGSAFAVDHGERAVAQRTEAAQEWFEENPQALVAADGRNTPEDVAAAVAWARQGAPLPPDLDLDGLGDDVWNVHYSCFAGWRRTSHALCPVGDED